MSRTNVNVKVWPCRFLDLSDGLTTFLVSRVVYCSFVVLS
jgi:hypothetical protein